MISSIIDVYKMKDISVQIRISIMIQLGRAINDFIGCNITEPLIYELVKSLDSNHPILTDEWYVSCYKRSLG